MPSLLLRERGNADRVLDLSKNRFLIGKREDCDLVLDRHNISRTHCEILQHNGQYVVRDLNSANGTWVNGVKITSPVFLVNGTAIQLGDYTLVFADQTGVPAPSGPPPGPSVLGNSPQRGSAFGNQPSTVRGTPSQFAPPPQPGAPAFSQSPAGAPAFSQPPAGAPAFSQPPAGAPAVQPQHSPQPPASAPAQPAAELPSMAATRDTADATPVIPADIKKKIHGRLIEHRGLKNIDIAKMPEEETRTRTRDAVLQIMDWMSAEIAEWIPRDLLLKEIIDEALGLGPLEDLLADDSISEIMLNNWDKIFIERKGKIVLSSKRFTDNQAVLNCIQRILSPIGRRIDESSPMVDGRLKDGSRVNAIIHPLSVSGPTLTIRKFMKKRLGPEDLIKFGSMNWDMANFIQIAVESHKNIVISGGTGSGKTTLLNVMAGFIPPDERIITVEDSAELRLPQEHVITLEAKPPNIEGEGAIPIRKLVINTLRMRPDRIVVGECRGGEAFDMLQAMNTGHDGSITTIHSNTPRDCIARMENLVLMAGMDIPAKAIREQIASAIHIIVQQSRMSDGSRKVTYITEVTGMESGTVTLQDIFLFKQQGIGPDFKVRGIHKATGVVPKFYDELRERGKKLDMKIFQG